MGDNEMKRERDMKKESETERKGRGNKTMRVRGESVESTWIIVLFHGEGRRGTATIDV